MMESQRNILLIGLIFVSFLLWQQWQFDHQPEQTPQMTATTTQSDTFIPESTPMATTTQPTNVPSKGQRIEVLSDVLQLTIDTQGGDIISAQLPAYRETLKDDTSALQLLNNTPEKLYIAQSGLIGFHGPDAMKTGRPVYQIQQERYELSADQDTLNVPLILTTAPGMQVTKTFVLKRGQYDIEVRYDIENQTKTPLQLQMYGQLKQRIHTDIEESSSGAFVPSAYRGAVYSSQDNHYKKISFNDLQESSLNKITPGGWIGMMQHYFTSVWIPYQEDRNQYYSRVLPQSDQAIVGFKSPLVQVDSLAHGQLTARLWLGPKLQDEMAQVAPYLNLTVDYGWLWFISQPLHWLLDLLHNLIANWGLSIIFLTFVVRSVMYPLTKAQYVSMAKMRLLQPKLMSLKERYGEDRQKMSQAMMELYKKEKVNPLGGCLPVLLQMPIFIALYWTLMESVELRHAPFILWIEDLSVKDPFFTLPILTGVTMYIMQKMNPATVTDPVQQKVMQFMPVLFTVFFLWCPAGLTLYWLVSNILTIIQQLLIFKQLQQQGLHTRQAN